VFSNHRTHPVKNRKVGTEFCRRPLTLLQWRRYEPSNGGSRPVGSWLAGAPRKRTPVWPGRISRAKLDSSPHVLVSPEPRSEPVGRAADITADLAGSWNRLCWAVGEGGFKEDVVALVRGCSSQQPFVGAECLVWWMLEAGTVFSPVLSVSPRGKRKGRLEKRQRMKSCDQLTAASPRLGACDSISSPSL